MGRRHASAVLIALVLLTGCSDDSGPTSRGSSLPAAPEGVGDGCREAAAVATFTVLCPAEWPDAGRPAKVRLRLYGSDLAYVLEAQTGFGSRSPVFHVLFGGQRRPFRAGFEGDGRQLRLTTRRVVTPYYASPRGGRILGRSVVELPTRRVDSTHVRGHLAAIMNAPPYPKGGIHGDHSVVMWNEGGHGYLVSTHSEISRRAATRAAIDIARSSRPNSR
jgi:hypothetical protein